MRPCLLIALLGAAAAATSGHAAQAAAYLEPAQHVVPTCPEEQAWFAGACRDQTWVASNLGVVDAASGHREANDAGQLRVLTGNTISWLAPVRVSESMDAETPRLIDTMSKAEGDAKRAWKEATAAIDDAVPSFPFISSRDLPTFAVSTASIAPDAVMGGYLVERRVTTSVERNQGGYSATLIEERLDLMAPGGPALVEVQTLEFDPTLASPWCEDDGPCVLAYAFSAGCVDEMIAAAEAEWVYIRTLVTGSLVEIHRSRDDMVRAYAELHACLGLPY